MSVIVSTKTLRFGVTNCARIEGSSTAGSAAARTMNVYRPLRQLRDQYVHGEHGLIRHAEVLRGPDDADDGVLITVEDEALAERVAVHQHTLDELVGDDGRVGAKLILELEAAPLHDRNCPMSRSTRRSRCGDACWDCVGTSGQESGIPLLPMPPLNGAVDVAAAAATPGCVRSQSTIVWVRCARRAPRSSGVGPGTAGSRSVATTSGSASKPSGWALNWRTVSISSPALTRRTVASASCPATTQRNPRTRSGNPSRPASRNAPVGSAPAHDTDSANADTQAGDHGEHGGQAEQTRVDARGVGEGSSPRARATAAAA